MARGDTSEITGHLSDSCYLNSEQCKNVEILGEIWAMQWPCPDQVAGSTVHSRWLHLVNDLWPKTAGKHWELLPRFWLLEWGMVQILRLQDSHETLNLSIRMADGFGTHSKQLMGWENSWGKPFPSTWNQGMVWYILFLSCPISLHAGPSLGSSHAWRGGQVGTPRTHLRQRVGRSRNAKLLGAANWSIWGLLQYTSRFPKMGVPPIIIHL